ncbi:nuclease [Altererythrobacter aurantiacus]|uniref:Nuclease n=1 Tax=Parapontixanthobacter aurantiacus TaxID=1463599 RepID=A0A844ZHS8_9SPHN|nr:nuclease [Parapontixanthobacter aurantiacus]MXO86497.1 nuclease [Parapontixanthobacter aurantiacus]
MQLTQALLSVSILSALGIGGIYVYHSGETRVARTDLPTFTCVVSSITDGDTLRCKDGTRVRLHAVAARETDGTCPAGHPCPEASAAAATAALIGLASGQALDCVQTGETYGRKAAICQNEGGVEINCAMIKSGTALVWPKFAAQHPVCQP